MLNPHHSEWELNTGKLKAPGVFFTRMQGVAQLQTTAQGQAQTTQELAVLTRAVQWSRRNGEEGILRLVGDGELLLRSHVNEVVKVTILKRNGEPLLTFNAVNRLYTSQGHAYLVIHFPKRMMPMWPLIAKEADDDGNIILMLTLTGITKHRRKREGGGG
jgi:hypothetical protein